MFENLPIIGNIIKGFKFGKSAVQGYRPLITNELSPEWMDQINMIATSQPEESKLKTALVLAFGVFILYRLID